MFCRRPADGFIHPDRFQARAAFAELTIDDNTGLVLTTPVALADIAGALVIAGSADGLPSGMGITVDATLDTFTVNRSGQYRVGFGLKDMVGVNAQALVATVVVNRAGAGFVEPSSLSPVQARITDKLTQPATAIAIFGMGAEGYLNLLKGDVVKFQISGSTGNVTIKRARLFIEQKTDASEQP